MWSAILGGGRTIETAENAGNDVADMREIPLHVAVIEHFDWAPFQYGLGEYKGGHVRATPATVYGKEAQPGHRNTIQMTIAMAH